MTENSARLQNKANHTKLCLCVRHSATCLPYPKV